MTIRKLTTTIAIGAATLALSATPAAAGHCAENDGPGNSGGAGNSNFATHVQNGDDNHGTLHNGWASCEDQANNESSRDS